MVWEFLCRNIAAVVKVPVVLASFQSINLFQQLWNNTTFLVQFILKSIFKPIASFFTSRIIINISWTQVTHTLWILYRNRKYSFPFLYFIFQSLEVIALIGTHYNIYLYTHSYLSTTGLTKTTNIGVYVEKI